MLAILGFQIKLQIKLPSPVVRTGNGQGQKVVKNFKKEGERERVADKNTWFSEFQRFKSSEFLIWRDHCGRPASCHLKGRSQAPATTGEKHDS